MPFPRRVPSRQHGCRPAHGKISPQVSCARPGGEVPQGNREHPDRENALDYDKYDTRKQEGVGVAGREERSQTVNYQG